MCGITGSGSGATAALGPATAIATAIALALTATAIALDPANTSSASPFALSATYAAPLLPFSAIVIALCLATGGVAIQPYCLASASALYPDLRCVVVLLFVEPYLHAVAPSPDSVPAQCTVLQYFSTVCALSGLAS